VGVGGRLRAPARLWASGAGAGEVAGVGSGRRQGCGRRGAAAAVASAGVGGGGGRLRASGPGGGRGRRGQGVDDGGERPQCWAPVVASSGASGRSRFSLSVAVGKKEEERWDFIPPL
jgi:hypothetical protein